MPEEVMKDMLGTFEDEPITEESDTEAQPDPEPEKTDTKPDTDEESDTAAETVEEQEENPDAELLKTYGLDGEFKTAADALASIKFKNKQIEEQRQREAAFLNKIAEHRSKLTADPEETPAPKLSPEEYQYKITTDPDFLENHLKTLGYVKRDEIAPIQGKVQELSQHTAFSADARVAAEIPELRDIAPILAAGELPQPGQNAMFDRLNVMLVNDPLLMKGYQAGLYSNGEIIKALYDKVKTNGNGVKPAAKVPVVTPSQKLAARTAGGGVRRDVKKTLADISIEEFEALDMKQSEKLLYEAGQLPEELLTTYRPPK